MYTKAARLGIGALRAWPTTNSFKVENKTTCQPWRHAVNVVEVRVNMAGQTRQRHQQQLPLDRMVITSPLLEVLVCEFGYVSAHVNVSRKSLYVMRVFYWSREKCEAVIGRLCSI